MTGCVWTHIFFSLDTWELKYWIIQQLHFKTLLNYFLKQVHHSIIPPAMDVGSYSCPHLLLYLRCDPLG